MDNSNVISLADRCDFISDYGRSLNQLYEKDNLLKIINKLPLNPDIKYFIYANNGPQYSHLLEQLANDSSIRILLYLSDETGFLPSNLLNHFDLIFKTYLNKPIERILPLPLILPDKVPVLSIKSIEERPVKAFFSGNLNFKRLDFLESCFSFKAPRPINKIRFEAIKSKLNQVKEIGAQDYSIQFTHNFRSGLSLSEYAKKLNNSKIALCPEGFFSKETFRHCEAARQGCIIISKKLPEFPFYENNPIISLEKWNDWPSLVDHLLNDPLQMEQIQKDTIHWYENDLSTNAISLYINRSIYEHLGIKPN
ncbi:MAG: hypothetical protein AAF363_16720 [Bacteroidota bacterium]